MAEIIGQGFLRTTNKKGGFLQEDVLNYVDELNGKIEELESKVKLSGENSNIEQESVNNAVLEKLKVELESSLKEIEQEKKKRLEEQKNFAEEKENLQRELQAVSNGNNGDNTELLQQLSRKDETIQSQITKIQQAFAILEENKEHLEESLAEIEEKNAELQEKDDIILSNEAVIKDKSNQINNLNIQIDDLKKRLSESGQSSATDMLGMIANITKTAQTEADKLKNESEAKAKNIIDNAKADAEKILSDANAEAQAISDDNNKKSETLNMLSETIKDMLKTQLNTVTENIESLYNSIDEAKNAVSIAEECIEDDEKLKDLLPQYTPTHNAETIYYDKFAGTEETEPITTYNQMATGHLEKSNKKEEPEQGVIAEPLKAEIKKEDEEQKSKSDDKWRMSEIDNLLKEVEESTPASKEEKNKNIGGLDDWGIDIEALTKAVEDDAQKNGEYNG